jgi:hypothetical protein
MILCESVKQTSQIYDLVMVAYSVSTPLTLGRGVSYKVGDLRQVSQVKNIKIGDENGDR